MALRRSRAREPTLFFGDPAYLSLPPPSRVRFLQPYQEVTVEVSPGEPRSYGPIAGSEGMGCEFFLDEKNRLCAMDLAIPFTTVPEVVPEEAAAPAELLMKERSRPARVTLSNVPKVPINAEVIWIPETFRNIIFSFERAADIESLSARGDETEFLEIARGVVLGMDRASGALRILSVDGFQWDQELFNVELTAQLHGRRVMDVINSIHLKYFARPHPEEFDALAHDALVRLRALEVGTALPAIDELIKTYRRNLVPY